MDNRKNDSEADLPERKEKTDNFIIVGVGASAGGLEAFSLFLSSLPAVINMAFILVQHLDPAHESELCTILSRTTSLPVIEVVDGLRILPNHIYVIPPNNLMTISGHILHLSPRVKSSTPFLSIDYFFKSLASEHKELSVGIVLSGSGIDGTSGIKEIKAAGGITFAQDKSSAKFDSMPEHAIESGDVDFVLPPSEIIQTLIRISRKYHLIKITEEQEIFNNEKDSFKKILYLLLTTAGVDFSAYRYTTIIRRIKRRMVVHGKENLAEYTKFLEDNPIEINTLFKEMLINVTSFFRDAEVFEELRKNILPPILKSKVAGGVFRVWVPGCSTGQEAYTIAMIIIECLDGLDKELSIQIFATDLSDSYVLEKARAGIYPNTIEAEVSPERLGRFFKKENGNYIISKPIREMCIFSKHNVVLDPPFSKIDLISCRNLLIYFSLALQQKVVQTFHYALNPEGLLLLGVAETIGSLTNLFISSNLKYRIYSRKAYAPQYPNFSTKGYISRISVASSPPITTISVKDWQNEADRVVLTKYSPSGILLNEELDILQFRGRTSPYLEAAPGAPSRNLLHMASEGMYFPIHNAIDQCRKDGLPVQRKGVLIRQMGQTYEVAFQVCPITLPESAEKCYLILFDKAIPSETMKASEDKSLKDQNDIIIQLHADLFSMNEYIQSIIEQKNELNDNLKLSIEEMLSSNEELQSTNEELQSTNEELETAKEEIQSVNEELVTLNDQLTNLNKELQESSDYAMAIVDTIREPLIVLDQSLRVQNVNQAFYDVFKATPDKTLDYSLWELGDKNWDIPELRKLLMEILPKNSSLRDFSVKTTFKEIGMKIMLLNARKITRKNSDTSLILLALEDVTERTELENKLKVRLEKSSIKLLDSYRHKDRFLAILAHELRNPLAPISNSLAIMGLPNADEATKEEARKIIERQLNHMVRLVDDLLDVSRIIAGKIRLRLGSVELGQLIKNAVEVSEYMINSRKHKLTISLPEEQIFLKVDEMRLIQVLSNLLNNAAKYTGMKGNIWLSAGYKNKTITIKVKDDGIGITSDMLPHVFDIFSQVDSSIERAQGGIGVGLALVKTIVELHGGTVKVESAGAGKGAEFIVRIPDIIASGKNKAPISIKGSYLSIPFQPNNKQRALVVDDNEPSARTLGKMLELLGYQVRIAYDGPSAIDMAKDFLPQVILLDIGLPGGMNGYDVCSILRKEPLLKDTFIAAQTGWGKEEHFRLSHEAGFDFHFVKPVKLNSLKEQLALNKRKNKLSGH